MKPLKFKKKLSLNKRTVVDLNIHEMKNAYGGEYNPSAAVRVTVVPPPTCVTCVTCVSCESGDTTLPPELCCICNDPNL